MKTSEALPKHKAKIPLLDILSPSFQVLGNFLIAVLVFFTPFWIWLKIMLAIPFIVFGSFCLLMLIVNIRARK